MNQFKHSIISAFVLIATASCQMADVDMRTFDEAEETRVLTLCCPVQETKAGLTDLQPFWQDGDEIWISDGTNSVKAVIPEDYDGLATATVEVSGLQSDVDLYALYPYNENASVSSGKIAVEVPVVQDGEFENAYLTTAVCKAGSDIVQFKNSSAMLKFNSAREEFCTLQIHNITLAFSGSYKVDPTTGSKASASNGVKKIRMDFGNKSGDKFISTMEANLPAGSIFTFITSDGRMGSLQTSQKNALTNGYLYDLGNIDDAVVLDSDPATDLSEKESANCYVVNKGGAYRFRAVRGNSDKSVGDVAYGDVVWETVNTATAPKKYTLAAEVAYSLGYMYIRLPENVPDGNVLVSACDKEGEILWSWHIWILKDGFKDQTYPSGAIMIDRNLGALNNKIGDPLSNGFLYEWGRKDPLLGSCSLTAATEMKSVGTNLSKVASSSKTGTVDYAISHPYQVIYNKSADWLQTADLSLWSSASKTEYDPCPPGYHIASESAFNDLATSGLNWNATNKGRSATINGDTFWFPACGYRYSGDGTLTKVGESYYCFYDQNSSSGNHLSWLFTSSEIGVASGTSPHSSAFSIRCQKLVSSGEKQSAVIKIAPTDGFLYVSAPYINSSVLNPISIVWGDEDTGTYVNHQYIYHNYRTAGKYSLTIECYDVDSFTIDPIGDTEEIDVSRF